MTNGFCADLQLLRQRFDLGGIARRGRCCADRPKGCAGAGFRLPAMDRHRDVFDRAPERGRRIRQGPGRTKLIWPRAAVNATFGQSQTVSCRGALVLSSGATALACRRFSSRPRTANTGHGKSLLGLPMGVIKRCTDRGPVNNVCYHPGLARRTGNSPVGHEAGHLLVSRKTWVSPRLLRCPRYQFPGLWHAGIPKITSTLPRGPFSI